MDDAIMKTGQWPNVAVPAGSDPAEVMGEYGVEPHGLRTAAYEYEQAIGALTEERDRLSRQLDAEHALVVQFEADNERLRLEVEGFGLGQFHAMYAERARECAALAAEVERLQGVVRTQAESFKGIEDDLAEANSACNTLRASVAGLKGTVERQRDELAEARHAALVVWRALDGLFLSDGAVTKALVDEWRRKLAGAGIEAS